MSRVKKNKETLDVIITSQSKRISEINDNVHIDNITNYYLGIITMLLVDISKSLAVIADNTEREDKNADSN